MARRWIEVPWNCRSVIARVFDHGRHRLRPFVGWHPGVAAHGQPYCTRCKKLAAEIRHDAMMDDHQNAVRVAKQATEPHE